MFSQRGFGSERKFWPATVGPVNPAASMSREKGSRGLIIRSVVRNGPIWRSIWTTFGRFAWPAIMRSTAKRLAGVVVRRSAVENGQNGRESGPTGGLRWYQRLRALPRLARMRGPIWALGLGMMMAAVLVVVIMVVLAAAGVI